MSSLVTRHLAPAFCALAVALLAGAPQLGGRTADRNATVASEPVHPPRPAPTRRPAALVPLYFSFGALQGLDVDSTVRALHAGGREANPILAPFAGSPGAMIAVKAGIGAATILASERMWKRNRAAAVVLMIAMNSAYAAVVAHNYAVAGRPKE